MKRSPWSSSDPSIQTTRISPKWLSLKHAFVIAALPALSTLASAQATETATFTLAEAWQQVSEANPSLSAARLQVERRVKERRATGNLSGPQVEVSGQYTMIDDPIVIDLDPIRSAMLALHPSVPSAAIPPFTQEVQDDQFLRAQLTAVLPVYAGGRVRAAKRAANAAIEQAEAEARLTGDSLLGELVRRFYGAQLAQVAKKTRRSVLDGLDEHVRQATRLEEEGFIAHADVLHAKVARDTAWREMRKAERQVEIAEAALAGLLAKDGLAKPASPLFIISEEIENMDTFIAAAEKTHPALAAVEAKRAQAAEGVIAERGKLLPEVYLFGSKELNAGDTTLLDPDWAVGGGVRIPLWDRNGTRQRVSAARLLEQRVEYLAENLRLGLRTLVEKSYREMAQAQEQFASLASALELAKENLRVREAAFREGQGTSLDVVDAQLSLAGVETERAAAAYEFSVALISLLETSGQPERFFTFEEQATDRISL